MTKKIAMFMMGVALFGGVLSFASANNSQASVTDDPASRKFGQTSAAAGVGVAGAGEAPNQKLITTIKSAINWVLSILGLITLVYLLWGGFQMVTAAGDNTKFGAGKTILKHAGIGLGFIAVSWMMVSMIFWLISKVT